MEHTGHHPGQGVGHGVKGHPAGGQVHTQTNRHADGGSDADASLVGHRHHRHRGSKAAYRQIPQQGQLGQGEQQGSQQQQQADGLPGGQSLFLTLFGPGGEGNAVEVYRRPTQQQFSAEEDQTFRRPALVGQVDEAGNPVDGGGGQRHKPAFPVGPYVKEGEGHRKDQHTGRCVPQALHKALHGQVAEAGPQQGAEAVQPRAGGSHQSQSEGGIAPEDLRPRQQGPQQKADDALGKAHQRRSTEYHLSRLPGLLPQPRRLGFQLLFCCHGPCLLCFGAYLPFRYQRQCNP